MSAGLGNGTLHRRAAAPRWVFGSAIPPRAGVRLDRSKLDFELARRGISAQELGLVIGVHAVVLSRARNGHAIRVI